MREADGGPDTKVHFTYADPNGERTQAARRDGGPERSQLAGGRLGAFAPNVVAGEADMLPAERRNVFPDIAAEWLPSGPEAVEGGSKIAGVPQDDGRDQQIEAGGAEHLGLEAPGSAPAPSAAPPGQCPSQAYPPVPRPTDRSQGVSLNSMVV
jgi:hypothetical protein